MTKYELIEALSSLPDTSEIFYTLCPITNDEEALTKTFAARNNDLGTVARVNIVRADGPEAPAFGILVTQFDFLR